MGKLVLIIDDDPGIADTIRQILTPAGYDTEYCQDSLKALPLVAQNTYDCVLLDIRMPKLEGTELLQLIKKGHPQLPVVIVSAFVDGADEKYYASLGAFDIIPKPFSSEMIVNTVSRAAGVFDTTRVTLTTLYLSQARDQIYRTLIVKALTKSGWNKMRAAELLGVSRYALMRWLKKLEIKY